MDGRRSAATAPPGKLSTDELHHIITEPGPHRDRSGPLSIPEILITDETTREPRDREIIPCHTAWVRNQPLTPEQVRKGQEITRSAGLTEQ